MNLQPYALRYVSDSEPGYSRKRWGRGFTYFDPHGKRVQDKTLRQRFVALTIPPAWQEVWICVDEAGHIQSTGRDAAARKQYIYHPRWLELRSQSKYDKLLAFGRALPQLRQQVDRDMGREKLSRRYVLGTAVKLLDETLIRIGNAHYTDQNGTYGLTTLEEGHVETEKSRIFLDFVGKSGVEHDISVQNLRLANRLRQLQELPGERLLQYVDEAGAVRELSSGEINAYLHEHMGETFTAKDFRTWGGTRIAFEQVAATTDALTDIVRTVSNVLGNTPAVCRKYYIHPRILQLVEEKRPFELPQDSPDPHLSPVEAALLQQLNAA